MQNCTESLHSLKRFSIAQPQDKSQRERERRSLQLSGAVKWFDYGLRKISLISRRLSRYVHNGKFSKRKISANSLIIRVYRTWLNSNLTLGLTCTRNIYCYIDIRFIISRWVLWCFFGIIKLFLKICLFFFQLNAA